MSPNLRVLTCITVHFPNLNILLSNRDGNKSHEDVSSANHKDDPAVDIETEVDYRVFRDSHWNYESL